MLHLQPTVFLMNEMNCRRGAAATSCTHTRSDERPGGRNDEMPGVCEGVCAGEGAGRRHLVACAQSRGAGEPSTWLPRCSTRGCEQPTRFNAENCRTRSAQEEKEAADTEESGIVDDEDYDDDNEEDDGDGGDGDGEGEGDEMQEEDGGDEKKDE